MSARQDRPASSPPASAMRAAAALHGVALRSPARSAVSAIAAERRRPAHRSAWTDRMATASADEARRSPETARRNRPLRRQTFRRRCIGAASSSANGRSDRIATPPARLSHGADDPVGIGAGKQVELFPPHRGNFVERDHVRAQPADQRQNFAGLRIVEPQIHVQQAVNRPCFVLRLERRMDRAETGKDRRASIRWRSRRRRTQSPQAPAARTRRPAAATANEDQQTARWTRKCAKESNAGCSLPKKPATSGSDSIMVIAKAITLIGRKAFILSMEVFIGRIAAHSRSARGAGFPTETPFRQSS